MKSARSSKKRTAWAVLALVLAVSFVAGGIWVGSQLTDAQLTARTTALLNAHLSGHFDIARVHYEFPAHLRIDDLRARSPTGAPVLAIASIRVDARLLPLFIGRVVVDDVSIDGLRADVIMPQGKEGNVASAFIDTFIPDFKLPALRDIAVPLRLDIRRFGLENGDVVIAQPPKFRARLRNMRISDASLWMQDDALRSSLTWTAELSAQGDAIIVDPSPVSARLTNLRLHFASMAIALDDVTATLPGFQAALAGTAGLARSGDADADLHGSISLDTQSFAPKVHRLDGLKNAVHGVITLAFEAQHTGQTGEAKLTLGKHDLRVQSLPIRELTIQISHNRRELTLKTFKFGLGEGSVEGHGTVALGTDPNVPLAEHDITWRAHAMPVRELARPVVSLPALLPEAVSFAVVSKGRALWPPTSQVDLDLVPEGLPGENWPGLPKAMELKGRFLTHPDLLEILKLEVGIDKVPDFAIQGALPLCNQSIFDVIRALHGPGSNSALRRIPVAPSQKKP